MAKYNEILVGRFNRALQRMTGIKGGPPTPQLAGEIMPVLPMFYGVEHRYLESWELFGVGTSVAAQGVGTNAALKLRNPAGSNMVAAIIKIVTSNTTAAAAFFGLTVLASNTDLATPVGTTGSRFDARGRPTPTAIMSAGQSTAGIQGLIDQATLSIYEWLQDSMQELPLLPGDSLLIGTNSPNNIGFTASIWWRERFLEDSELK